MSWYLIYTKPKQEWTALQNLSRQGYECYLPHRPVEKLRRQKLTLFNEALFPRYLFVRQTDDGQVKSCAPIRSTLGVVKIVSFGLEPVRVPDQLVTAIQAQENRLQNQPDALYQSGERVRVFEGGFMEVEAIYEAKDGEGRAFVLIEMLGKLQRVSIAAHNLRNAE